VPDPLALVCAHRLDDAIPAGATRQRAAD
jgi:hypothetical protein